MTDTERCERCEHEDTEKCLTCDVTMLDGLEVNLKMELAKQEKMIRDGRMMDEDIKFIADTYGYEVESRQMIEEMAELTQAINKYWKKDYDSTGEVYNNLVEEIADVSLVLKHLVYLLGCEDEVVKWEQIKATRQVGRICDKG